MSFNEKISLNEEIKNLDSEYQLDLKQIVDTLIRNKRLIATFTFGALVLSALYAFTVKKVWRGDFQIVLENEKKVEKVLAMNPSVSNLTGITSQASSLKTEVEILKSPSVLINIFQFLKKEKELKRNKDLSELKFKDWRDSSLSIELEKNTSILNIAYMDTDKNLILPVLNKISSAYQEYSGIKRLRVINLGLDYFEEQIALYKERSTASLIKAQKFAIDQDLSVLEGESEIDKEIPNSINIELNRVKAANELRFINQNIKQVENLKNGSDQIAYIALTMTDVKAIEDLTLKLEEIDTDLGRFRLTFKESDDSIQDLIKDRNVILNLLTRQVKGVLIAQKAAAQARLNASERPKGILIKYRQLLSAATKDKATLDQLENEYRILLLEKAKNEEPWELITTPTLLDGPIAPEKKKIVALGFIGGILLGGFSALISDKRKDIIFSTNEIEALSSWPSLVDLSVDEKESWRKALDLVVLGPLSKIDGSIALIIVGDLDNSTINYLQNALGQALEKLNFIITKDLREAINFSNIIVVTELGISKNQEFIHARKNLILQEKNVLGIISLIK